jgi:hypothetical protein
MRTRVVLCLLGFILASTVAAQTPTPTPPRWAAEKAHLWYGAQPRLAGANFIPSNTINQLEMWQADTFDLTTIDRELGWAEQLGFNTMRVFLHDLMWTHDRDGFIRRIDQFLAAADKHHIKILFVIFDGVWDPYPKLGKQRDPRPHTHNSGWLQSPGREILEDPKRVEQLEDYVKGIVKYYGNDRRVLAWDVFNEPDNPNTNSYGKVESPDKSKLAIALLKKTFDWARQVNPSQPLTAGVWRDEWSDPAKLSEINKLMLEESDVISFHDYTEIGHLRKQVESLKKYGRPVLCTEYMNRQTKSFFNPNLGYLRGEDVAAYNWGLVSGKTQTIYPWDSWDKPYTAEPAVWFHDVFRQDGTPFDPKETEYIKQVTGAN